MSEKSIGSLIEDLTCDDIIKCQDARRSLVAMGHDAVPSLVKALASKHQWTRWEAIKALGQIGDPSSIEVLINALEDKQFDVRWLAAEGLISIGKKAVVPLLQALIENSSSIWLSEGAHHVLHDMNRKGSNRILKPVMVALEDAVPSLQVPIAAETALLSLDKLKRKHK